MITWGYNQQIKPDLKEEQIRVWVNKIQGINFDKQNNIAYGNMLLKFIMESTKQKGIMITFLTMSFSIGTKLYRTRVMNVKEIDSIDNVKHFWSPPSKVVKYGRANKPKSPMLYTTLNNKELAILENTEIKDDFILIEYTIINSLILSYIGPLFNDGVNFKFNMPKTKEFHIINNFCKDLFSIKHTNENYYVFTNSILDRIYLPNASSKNYYVYHSAIQSNLLNVCINPSHEEKKLIITEVSHMKKISDKNYKILKRIKHKITI